MESYCYKCKSTLKFVGLFTVLLWALLFASPASATPREVNNTLSAAPTQLAYYGGYYHYRWNHHRHWRHWHHHRNWRHWHHWHRH